MPAPSPQTQGRPKEVQGMQVKTYAVESTSVQGKFWEVTLWMEGWRGFTTGLLTCKCPKWLYQGKPLNERSCHHTEKIAKQLAGHKDLVERVTKSEIFLKTDLPNNGRLNALIQRMLAGSWRITACLLKENSVG